LAPRPPLDWDLVRVFLAVARPSGLGRGAVALALSEATVGRHVAALEQALGARLFGRLPNRVELTALGRRLVAVAAQMEDGAAGLERLAMASVAEPGMPVRITATTAVALFLAGHLAELITAAGGAPVELVNTRVAQNLAHREAEIALRMRRPPERGDLAVRRVGRLAVALYAARVLLDRRGAKPADLGLIGLREDPNSRQSRWLDALAEGVQIWLRLGELPLRLEAVRQGLGASLLPCFIGDREPGLCRVLPLPAELAEDVYLLVHADLKDLPQVRAVSHALVLLFARHAAELGGMPVADQAASRLSPTAG
jgi:DNA-binding transcriptional LysR family regulator